MAKGRFQQRYNKTERHYELIDVTRNDKVIRVGTESEIAQARKKLNRVGIDYYLAFQEALGALMECDPETAKRIESKYKA